MRDKFWQGLIWGGIVGTLLGAIMGPMAKPRRKPLVERSADAFKETTRDIMRSAYKARKELMKRID